MTDAKTNALYDNSLMNAEIHHLLKYKYACWLHARSQSHDAKHAGNAQNVSWVSRRHARGTSDGGVTWKGWRKRMGDSRCRTLDQKQNHVNCNSYCRSKPVSPQKNTSEQAIEACKQTWENGIGGCQESKASSWCLQITVQ
jgi:hypothetical protein